MTEKRIVSLVCALSFVAVLIAPCAAGDGVVMDFESIDLVHEEDQTAIIHLSGGYQRMVLSIDIDRSSSSVWLFPVPADPGEITLDHDFMSATLSGEDILGTAEMEIEEDKAELFAFHAASLFPLMRFLWMSKSYTNMASDDLGGPQVHQILDKGGVHSEVVTAKNGTSLTEYLRLKGKEVPPILEPKIAHYASLDYSFVVSWINGSSDDERPSIALSFPRTELYYPMILTSAYGDMLTPVNLIVLGHYEIANRGLGSIDGKYYANGRFEGQYSGDDPFREFMDLDQWDGKFTTIGIETSASSYETDLVFAPHSPTIKGSRSSDANILIFVMASFFAATILGFISSTIAFKGDGKERVVFGSLGILNAFAIWIFILGFLAASIAMKKTNPLRILAFMVLFQGLYMAFVLIFINFVLFKI